jgi:hypothetical protein
MSLFVLYVQVVVSAHGMIGMLGYVKFLQANV